MMYTKKQLMGLNISKKYQDEYFNLLSNGNKFDSFLKVTNVIIVVLLIIMFVLMMLI